ncbi:MAG: response regulator [Opitutus sp.]|nr:response regulator [Opitutus sp.]
MCWPAILGRRQGCGAIHPPMARILLIDDDRALRNVVAKSLGYAGHEVIQAEDGLQGIELSRATTVDLVITDLIMPVKEGVETIILLCREHPNLPVIAISGGLSNSSTYLEIAAKIGARRVLPKPFTAQELIALVKEVLGEAGASGAR